VDAGESKGERLRGCTKVVGKGSREETLAHATRTTGRKRRLRRHQIGGGKRRVTPEPSPAGNDPPQAAVERVPKESAPSWVGRRSARRPQRLPADTTFGVPRPAQLLPRGRLLPVWRCWTDARGTMPLWHALPWRPRQWPCAAARASASAEMRRRRVPVGQPTARSRRQSLHDLGFSRGRGVADDKKKNL